MGVAGKAPDALFHYLQSARRQDQSWRYRLLLRDENLLAAGVERLVETAAVQVVVFSQHETIRKEIAEGPAAHPFAPRFYDEAAPIGPKEGHFLNRTEGFPLGESLRVKKCPGCWGKLRYPCGNCKEAGIVPCKDCRRFYPLGCSDCNDEGSVTCPRCDGLGHSICSTCVGTGQFGNWTVAIHEWTVEERSQLVLPAGHDDRLLEASQDWLSSDFEGVPDLELATVAEHLGYETPESREMILRATELKRQFEDAAARSDTRCLFTKAFVSLIPIAHSVMRDGAKARTYWLVGRGADALEIKPENRVDPFKVLGWLGLGTLGTLAMGGLGMVSLPAIIATGDALALAAAISAALSTGGSWQILHRAPAVPVIAVLSAEHTPWLSCIAFLGSYTRHLRVLDSNYQQQLLRLLRDPGSRRRSRNLSLELKGGRRVRLVEIAGYDQLPESQLNFMLGTVDGLLLLGPSDHPLPGLLAPLRNLGSATPPCTTFSIDGGPGNHAADSAMPQEAMALESLHRAFVEDMRSDIDWKAAFKHLWQPVEDLLSHGREGRGRV